MNSKPCATCVEVTVAVLICAIIGACIFVSLHNVPTQKTQQVESHPTLKTAAMSSSPMLVPIPVSTAPKPLKLVTIVPEKN